MFGTVEGFGEMLQASIVQKGGGSLSSSNQIGNPVVYKLVRVAADGSLVPATDDELLEVNCSVEGLYQSETAHAYTEEMNSRIDSKAELMYGSPMLFTLPDTKSQSSSELSGNEEQVQPKVLLQEPNRFSLNACRMNQSMDVSPYSDATGSPEEPALSTAASEHQFARVADKIFLDNLSIKALQETFRATFGRETTVKDKQWLKRRISMGLKLIDGGQDNYTDTIDAFSEDTVDEERTSNCKDTSSSPDCIKGHSNDIGHSPVETFVDHYYGNEDFEGEHRSVKRVRKPTRRYIEELSKTDEKQQSGDSLIPSKDERSIQAVSSGGRVVASRMIFLAGSRLQVPYVSNVRRSRPRENIMALWKFHSRPWEVKATTKESNLNLSPSQLNNEVNRVSGVKSASGPVQKESGKDNLKPNFTETDQDIMKPEHLDSSEYNSDGDNNRVDLPVTQSSIRRKHHRAWTLSEVVKLVEGVSKLGVGKWSEIKKLSFSSYPYRTSVDLKDKWRNLQKASFAQTCSNKMGSLRKHASMAIPSQILLQVRELAQKQSLVSPVSKARLIK